MVYDYWGRIGYVPTGLALIRFWREGSGGPEDEALYENIAGSCVFMSSREWSGWEASTARQMHEPPPPDEAAGDGQWRWIGWRVGTVFRTKVVPQEYVALFTQAGFRRRDGIVLLGVFLAWIALALALIGFRTPIFIIGGMTVMGGLVSLRKQGLRAVLAVAAVLSVLLGIGLVT